MTLFKSKSNRIARQRQRLQEEADAEAARLAANLLYLDNCHRTYSCIHCRTHLATHDDLLSKLFQGNHGRAYLFNQVVNVGCRMAIARELLTGLHAVSDIFCKTCETTLGWKYELAYVPSQKYKEGKFIIELVHMIKENDSDPSSFARGRQLFQGASRQEANTYEQVYLSPSGATAAAVDWSGRACAPRAPSAAVAKQQPQASSVNNETGRDRPISVDRNGPSPASTPAVTCASRDEGEVAGREHAATAAAAETTNHDTEQNPRETPSNGNNEESPASAKTSDTDKELQVQQANDLRIAISEAGGRLEDEMLEGRIVAPREVQPSSVVVVVCGGGGGVKEIETHRDNHQLISSSPASDNLAPTSGGSDGAAQGSSAGSSQLSSAFSASSSSLATVERQDQPVVGADVATTSTTTTTAGDK